MHLQVMLAVHVIPVQSVIPRLIFYTRFHLMHMRRHMRIYLSILSWHVQN